MKTNFDNSLNLENALRKGGLIGNVMFLFSVITTALAFSVIALAVFFGGYQLAPTWAVWLIPAVSLVIGVLLDFWGVKPFALAMFTEWVALLTGRFAFTWLRAFSATAFAVIFAFLFFVSFSTSRQGAAIVGATTAPSIDVAVGETSAAKIDSIRENRMAPFQTEIARLEKERDQIIAGLASPWEAVMLKKGSDRKKLAIKGKIDQAAAPIREQYAARIEEEREAMTAALSQVAGLEKTIAQAAQAKNEQQVEAASAMTSGIVGIVMNFGAYSIIVGLALLFVRAVNEVEQQLPARAPSGAFVGGGRLGNLFSSAGGRKKKRQRARSGVKNGAPF